VQDDSIRLGYDDVFTAQLVPHITKVCGTAKTEEEGNMFVSDVGNQLSSDAVSYPGITVQ
jgi:hypothetical protein